MTITTENLKNFLDELEKTIRAIEGYYDKYAQNPKEILPFPYGAYGMNNAYHHECHERSKSKTIW